MTFTNGLWRCSIDSYDWVMVPNVYGMSSFSDGGKMSTKPYISGSNYIKKMSDYTDGEWTEKWNALFWNFVNDNREFFKTNPRLGMMLRTLIKWLTRKNLNILISQNRRLKI